MKPRTALARSERGNTYLTVLWILLLSGMVLAAYLTLVGSQNSNTMRSQAWNRAIAVSEAGIEDAMAHLHRNGLTNGAMFTDGWWETDGKAHKVRLLDDAIYDVVIDFSKDPVVYSRGHVPLIQNFQLSAFNRGTSPIMADLFYWWWSSSRYYVNRTLKVETKSQGMFTKGLVARDYIDLNGNNIRTDSFDSIDPSHSTNGLYYFPWAKDNGDIATVSGLTNSVNVDAGNADIYGRVATGPRGRVSVGPNGSIGSKNWHDQGNSGIEPGYFRDDMNVSFPPVPVPFSSGSFTPAAGAVNGTNYALVLGDGKYLSSGNVKFTGADTVLINGKATWWCQNGIDLGGKGAIVIAPGASLRLFVGKNSGSGTDASLTGNGVMNCTGNATNFSYFGLTSNTSMKMSGNSAIVAAIYAPSASVAMNGGGNNIVDFSGAGIFANIVMNGHYNFHYDENLGRLAPLRGYVITAWSEL